MVSVPMIFFVEFVGDLQSIMEAIHSKTKAVFIPIAIQISPINPSKHFIVGFRKSTTVQCIPTKGWFTEKIPDLAKKFSYKIESVVKKGPTDIRYGLEDQLKAWHESENLRIIGGFKDGDNLKLLFYKEDKQKPPT